MEIFKFCNTFIMKYRATFYAYIFLSILTSCLSALPPLVSGLLVDVLVYKQNKNMVIWYCVIIATIVCLNLLFGFLSSRIYIHLQTKSGFAMNTHVIEHVQNMSIKYVSKQDTVYLNRRINNDTNTIIMFYINTINGMITNTVLFIFSLVMLLKINNKLIIIVLIINLLFIFIYMILKKQIYKKSYEMKEAQSDFFSRLNEQLHFLKFLKVHSSSNILKKKLHSSFENVMKKAVGFQKSSYLYSSCDRIISLLQEICIFLIGGFAVIDGKITIGKFTMISSYFTMITKSSRYFFDLGKVYQENLASYRRIKEILSLEKQVQGKNKVQTVSKITIDRLSFDYDNTNVFNNFSIEFKKGNIYSIKGKNGSGKSTLINLILGLFVNDYSGDIKYNDMDIKNINMQEARLKNVGLTEQEPLLIIDTLKNNILLNSNTDDATLQYFITMMGLNDYIFSLEKGLETIINDKSTNISGGEKQKISIIRQLIKNPDVFIFDEPTSALDQESQTLFINYLEKIKKDKIIIVITHNDNFDLITDYTVSL